MICFWFYYLPLPSHKLQSGHFTCTTGGGDGFDDEEGGDGSDSISVDSFPLFNIITDVL